MPGFLLQDDAKDARLSAFDEWADEQKRKAQETAQAAQSALQTTAQNVASTVQNALPSQPQPAAPAAIPEPSPEASQRLQEFDTWATQQQQQAAQPAPAPSAPVTAPLLSPGTTSTELPPPSPEAAQRLQDFDSWVTQRAQPVQQALTGATEAVQSAAGSGAALLTPPPGNSAGESATAPDAQSTEGGPSGQQWRQIAEAQLSKPYIWGSAGGRSDMSQNPAGFDCSGFVSYVMKTGFGVDLPAFTGSAYKETRALGPNEQPRPGDVVFYNMSSGDPHEQHIALYIGDGQIIQAGGTRHDVNKASADQPVGSAPEYRRPTALDTPRGNAMAQSVVGSIAQTASDATQGAQRAVGTAAGGLQDVARQAAQEAGIDPDIFVRQIQQESGFNPTAKSAAGAIGIAQFMPDTARGRGIDPTDPIQALYAAAKMDAEGLLRYGGSWAKTLAAYNAGPGAVEKYGGVPPYQETQRYVNNILQGGKDIVQDATTGAQQAVSSAGQRAQQTGQDILGTLGQGAQSVADRAQTLADQSTQLAQESARRAQQAQDLLNTTRQNIGTENDRYLQQREQDRGRTLADIMQPRRFDLSMGTDQAVDTGGFRAPDLSGFLSAPPPGETPHPLPGRPGGLVTPPGSYNPAPGSIGAAISEAVGGALEPVQQPVQQAGTSFLDTLAQNAQATADRAKQLADQSGQLAASTGEGLRQAPDRLQQVLQNLTADTTRSDTDQRTAQQALLDRLLQPAQEFTAQPVGDWLSERGRDIQGFVAPGVQGLNELAQSDLGQGFIEGARQSLEESPGLWQAEQMRRNLGTLADPRATEQERNLAFLGGVGGLFAPELQPGEMASAVGALGRGGAAGRALAAARPLVEEAVASDIASGQASPRILQAVQDFVRSRQGTGRELGGLGDLAGRQSGQIQAGLGLRLGTGLAGGIAGNLTTPEEAGPVERVGRTLGGVGLGLAAPSGVEALLSRPQIDQTILESLRRGGLTQGPPTITRRATPTGVIVDMSKQGMLTDPLTHIQNMVGNTIELLRQPVSLAMGGRAPEAGAGLTAVARAIPEAIRNARLAMHGLQVPSLGEAAQYTGRGGPVFRILSASDMFTRTLGEYQGMASKAVQLLRDAGIQPGTSAADAFLARHANELYREGARTGASGVFGQARQAGVQSSRLDKLMASFGHYKEALINNPDPKSQALGALLDFSVPFQGTPTRIWQVALQRIPGITQVAGTARIARALQSGDTFAAQKALGELTAESMIQAQIAQGIREGNITGPDDPEHPNSFRVMGQWLPTRALGAYGTPMGVMAAFADGWQKANNEIRDPDEKKAVMDHFGSALNASMEPLATAVPGFTMMSLLAGLGHGSGLTGFTTRTVEDALNRLTSPAILNRAENVLDPYMRDVAKTGFEQLWEPTLARNPLTARFLPPKIDPLTGNPMERPSGGLGSLLGIENRPETPLRNEVNRLHHLGYSVTVPKDYPDTVTYKGSEIKLTPDEQRAVTRTTGGIAGELADTLNSAAYQRASDDQKAHLVSRILSKSSDKRFAAFVQTVGYDEARRRLGLGQRTVGRLNVQSEVPVLSVLEQEDAARAR